MCKSFIKIDAETSYCILRSEFLFRKLMIFEYEKARKFRANPFLNS